MPKSRIIVTIAVIVALMPFLGFPHAWEAFFQVVAGIAIILLSVWANIDKRLMLKAKAQKRQVHKHLQAKIQAEQAGIETQTNEAVGVSTESVGKGQL